ncbi:hypothetical protein GGX14DRAFT_408464 [Mycena pura]|uniref:Uncharacterized protein n=1 Tax=Mycena pura TaxID=153505 RepID=A0AAD6UP65_9AGAR|nr:hypothetical protein GGX14DRAFT_408464 [Mycena pura]
MMDCKWQFPMFDAPGAHGGALLNGHGKRQRGCRETRTNWDKHTRQLRFGSRRLIRTDGLDSSPAEASAYSNRCNNARPVKTRLGMNLRRTVAGRGKPLSALWREILAFGQSEFFGCQRYLAPLQSLLSPRPHHPPPRGILGIGQGPAERKEKIARRSRLCVGRVPRELERNRGATLPVVNPGLEDIQLKVARVEFTIVSHDEGGPGMGWS